MEELTEAQVNAAEAKTAAKLASLGDETNANVQESILEEEASGKLKPEVSALPSTVKPTGEEETNKGELDSHKQEAETEQELADKTAVELPTLPDAYKRTAIHQEWTEDEINEFYNADPDKALKTFAKLHESNNILSKQFSELGMARQQQEDDYNKRTVEQAKKPAPVVQPKVSPIDMAELKRQYGDDPIVDIVKQLSDRIIASEVVKPEPVEPPATVYQPYNSPRPGRSYQSDVAALKTLDIFFDSDEVKSYGAFYGEAKDWNQLTPVEFANRREVVQLAGSIAAGSDVKGEHMPDELALEKAHFIVSQPFLEKAIVADIHTQLGKRSNSMTLRSNTGQQTQVDTAGKTGSELTAVERETRAKARLNKIFNNS